LKEKKDVTDRGQSDMMTTSNALCIAATP